MRLLHVGDLHLGKKLYQYSLEADQTFILHQILTIARQNEVSALLLAGDIFDSSVPPQSAVALWDHFLTAAVKQGLTVFFIAGNHDSAIRLGYGSNLLESSRIYAATEPTPELKRVTFSSDGEVVDIYLLPYVHRPGLRRLLQVDETSDLTFSRLMTQYLAPLKPRPETDISSILLAHQWVVNGSQEGTGSDSEMPELGRVEQLDAACFQGFSYLALGHLHRPQAVSEQAHYAGSILAYSASEADLEKSLILLEIRGGELTRRRVPLTPLHQLRVVEAYFDDLFTEPYNAYQDDYLFIHLLDEVLPVQVGRRLQNRFPRLCQIIFSRYREAGEQADLSAEQAALRSSPYELFLDFFAQETGHAASAGQQEIIRSSLHRSQEEA